MSVRIVSSVVAAAVVGVLASACKPKVQPCPAKFSAISADRLVLPEVQCSCDATNAGGSVWGSGVYTTDSSVCAAAVHAGALPATGGIAKMTKGAGCKHYTGSTANGITSSGWGDWGTSFYFTGHGDGACPKIGDGGICPAKIKDVPEQSEMTCTCDKDGTVGSVWGSGIYTTDSSICAAGVHAGAIPATGGKLHVKRTTGCPAYAASSANGISASSWGSYEASIYFPEKGDGKCVVENPDAPCPSRYADIPGYAALTSFTCKCPPGKPSGSVWGTGVYTHDSSVCGAAVHAGAIPMSGGKVTVKSAAGCPSYKGSLGHGITSSKWGSYGGSFYVAGSGDGTCSK